MKEIEIEIKADGTVIVHVNGVAGPACEELTKSLEESLGAVVRQEKTAEYYATAVENYTEQR
jgi:Protein of unknown function (DUF2997)